MLAARGEDGGTATHNIVAPAAGTTYTVTYSAQVAAVAPVNTVLPALSGAARVGSTLSASKGTWTGTQPIACTYQWLTCDTAGNNCTAIAGATGATYLVRSHRLRARVTAKNVAGSSSAMSAATATVAVR